MAGSQPTSLDVEALEELKGDEAQISALNHPRVFGWYCFVSKFSDAKKAQLPKVEAPAAAAPKKAAAKSDETDDLNIRLNNESIETLPIEDLTIHQEHLRGIISQHVEETDSIHAQNILNNFDAYAPLFKLVKPKATDVKTLLGHRSRSSAELRVQAQ